MVDPLAARGIDLDVVTFLDDGTFHTLYDGSAWPSTVRGVVRGVGRLAVVPWRARSAEVLLVQREAALLGPPVVELAARRIGRASLVLDLDDATYVRQASPVYGALATVLRWPGKTDALIRRAALVTCGSPAVADHARSLGARTAMMPTVVDTDRFRPRPAGDENPVPVVGWVGSHSTFPWLEALLPTLAEVARRRPFALRVVGSGRASFVVDGLHVESVPWCLEREVEDFQRLDIGLYPMADTQWTSGKSALKSIQYMAVGIPFVVSPVGAAAVVGEAGVTHLEARSPGEWRSRLEGLLADPGLRARMGAAGRDHVVRRYNLPDAADRLAAAIGAVAGGRRQPPGRPPGGAFSGR
ncbi:MAG: glycosyltransferase family 4 protein [Actinomycetes bacterium]